MAQMPRTAPRARPRSPGRADTARQAGAPSTWSRTAVSGATIQECGSKIPRGARSGDLRDYQALRPDERDVVDEAPAVRRKPLLDFRHAVDVAVAQVHGELAGHERRLDRLRVGRVGPEVGEQESRSGGRGGADAAQQRGVAR